MLRINEMCSEAVKYLKGWSYYLRKGGRYQHSYYPQVLCRALEARNLQLTDISDHLNALFFFAVTAQPSLIVELGTRGGDSTRSLLAAASLLKAKLLSIDIEDCSQIEMPYRDNWHFVKEDDVAFAKTGFVQWCQGLSINPEIDLLFIDTSHEYEHTKQELEVWGKYLSSSGMMIFHDSNMGKGIYARTNGSIGYGWDNKRGVIRAIEEYLGRSYDENTYFSDVVNGYSILHYPNSNGLTVIKKLV